jgi:hypothetical protein
LNEGDRYTGKAHEFQFGACGTVRLIAFGCLEAGLEACAEWLTDHAPGCIEPHDHEWEEDELDGDGDPVDHTYTESGWIPSWEWYVNDYDFEQACREYGLTLETEGFDREAILDAWYIWLRDNNAGAGSREYARLSRLRRWYRPCDPKLKNMDDAALAIWARIGAPSP